MAETLEYWVEEIRTTSPQGIAAKLNELAGYGWKLVVVAMPFYYFKREASKS